MCFIKTEHNNLTSTTSQIKTDGCKSGRLILVIHENQGYLRTVPTNTEVFLCGL